jgi:hypothetical protein
MKKRDVFVLVVICAFLLFIPFSLGEITSVTPNPIASAVLVESNNSAIFNLTINSTQEDEIEIYALAGMMIEPSKPIELKAGSNIIEIKAYPNDMLKKQRGVYSFEYKLKDRSGRILTEYLKISIAELKDAISFKTLDVEYKDNEVKTVVTNLQEAYLNDLKIKLFSSFFDDEKTISLKPKEEVVITSAINKANISSLPAGSFVLKSEVSARGVNANFDSSFRYIPKPDVLTKEVEGGIIIRKNVVEKTNNGNVPATVQISIKKDIFSRLFTMHSLDPTKSERSGLFVTYSWEKRLEPSEKFYVSATTNYTLPFLFIVFIIIIVLFIYSYTRTNLVLIKRVSYVKTKGGEFALKVRIYVRARRFVEDIRVTDRLPGMTMLYERFGNKPNKIDHSMRKLFWNIDKLNVGEERVFSYIVYSKLKVVGKFELPPAAASFSREGKTNHVVSNRTFFISGIADGI